MSASHFEFRAHSPTGEVFAVEKTLDGQVIAAAGPVHYLDVDPDDLEGSAMNCIENADAEEASDDAAALNGWGPQEVWSEPLPPQYFADMGA